MHNSWAFGNQVELFCLGARRAGTQKPGEWVLCTLQFAAHHILGAADSPALLCPLRPLETWVVYVPNSLKIQSTKMERFVKTSKSHRV